MRKLVTIIILSMAAVALFITLSRSKSAPSNSTVAPSEAKAAGSSSFSSGQRPTLAPEAKQLPHPPSRAATAPEERLPQRIGVRISEREQRQEESDDQYRRRLSWLDKFASFEERANLSADQRERLLNLLADKQEEAILSWEATARGAREATLEDLERAAKDPSFEAYPSILSLENSLRRDLWVELRSILTTKQIVSFRRTSRLNSVMGYGRWLPLEIETRQASDTGEAP
jgi:predicted transcriptional regulator